ncbi:MAG TPA: glycosyltransferase family A protein, partial [Candidatus Caenarcaniphilales bacterium]
MPAISVIVPAYNAESTIVEAVVSVQKQTFSDFELIIIDDGSCDKTLEQLSKLRESRLKVFSYTNAGVSTARNRGISCATGEFIAFLDADDVWMPDKLELQLAVLKQHPEAGVAYSWTNFIDEKGKLLNRQEPVFFEGDVYPQLLVSNFLSCGSVPLIRKQAIASTGEFDPFLKSVEDWDYWLRLAASWPFVLVTEYQTLYRQTEGSMTSKVEVIKKYNLFVIERAFQAAPREL